MGTKTRREEQVRALIRLLSQCRLNVGDAQSHGRRVEEQAWRDVEATLQYLVVVTRAIGLPVQKPIEGLEP